MRNITIEYLKKSVRNTVSAHLRISFLLSFFWTALGLVSSTAQCGSSDLVVTSSGTCVPALVRFVVSPAFPKGSIYYWDLEDGNGPVLGADTFYHTYSAGGNYGIVVTIKKPDSTQCVITKAKGYISFNASTSLGFYASQTTICSYPAVISLHDTTGNIASRDWYINGVLYNDHSRDITDTVTATGYYSISEIVYDNSGCTEPVVKKNYIYVSGNIPVNFCAVMHENATHNQITATYKIGFDTTGFGIIDFKWAFPGGNITSYKGYSPPSITYASLSSFYDVSLTVNTTSGCTVTYTKQSLVGKYYSVLSPTICEKDFAVIDYIAPRVANKLLDFYNIRSDFNSYYNLGPGNVSIKFLQTGQATIVIPIQYYTSNCIDTLIVPKLINVLPTIADFTTSYDVCKIPGFIRLHALHGNPSVGQNFYTWQFFDSTNKQITGSPIGPISATDTTFKFTRAGVYYIKLISSNSSGCTDSTYKFLRVGVPDINYTIKPDSLCEGDTIYINNLSKSVNAPGSPIFYDWKLINRDSSQIIYESKLRSPRMVINYPGVYNLSYLIATTQCSATQNVNNAVTVEGIAANIVLSGHPGCPPLTNKLSALINVNIPAGQLMYSWSISPAADASILNPTAVATDVIFEKQECYTISLHLSNGKCSSTTTYDTCIGTNASFTANSVYCRNTPVTPINTSSPKANIFKWAVSPSTGWMVSSDTAKNPFIKFTKPGCYNVTLKTADSLAPTCFDSATQKICVYQPPLVKSAYSPDSASHCAPRVDHFVVNSVNGKTFFWDFGDSSYATSGDSAPKHAYFKNNNTGFTVKVVAIDSNGCASDTFVLFHYIKISGPEPAFSIASKPPCNGGVINFINQSQYIHNYYFVYGDNSGIDSNQINPHFYKYVDYSKDSNTYQPSLYAYDETGCVASATQTVKLYRPPFPKISTTDTLGCSAYHVQFVDSTLYAAKYSWAFGDGTTDTTVSPAHTYTLPDTASHIYSTTLTATSDRGCVVTSPPIMITVHPTPVLKMTVTAAKVLCYTDSVFYASSTNIPVARYHWKFGDGSLASDTSTLQNTKYHYTYPGKHTVTLTVQTKYGCAASKTDSTSVNSLDTIPPVIPSIYYVTVTPNNQIEIVFAKVNDPQFSYNTIYALPGPDSISANNNSTDTVYYDAPPRIDVTLQPYKYTTRSTDVCGYKSAYARAHQTVFLTVNKALPRQLLVSWTRYIGWDTVLNYKVYKQSAGGKFNLLATIYGLDTFFLDTALCPENYTYYVVANHPNGIFHSQSNIASNVPDYVFQSSPLYIRKATVVNDKDVLITWYPGMQTNITAYVIDRKAPGSNWQLTYGSTQNLFFTDNGADVKSASYIYRIKAVDDCGNTSVLSNIGTSILLTGASSNTARYLTWNHYALWKTGVESYHLQIIQNDGSYKDYAVLSGNDTTFMDSAAHADLNVPTCYRVYAVEKLDSAGNIDTSYSNIACPNLPARLFVPNAFSPNGDDDNDVFIPKGLSIYINSSNPAFDYSFKIYNRWGQLLFETTDFRKGWDGKFQGALVPVDNYIYSVDGRGYDGQRFHLKGNVTIVR